MQNGPPAERPGALAGEARATYVRDMFSRIAPRYDIMNRLMTAGQDIRWRKEVIQRAAIPDQGRLLDLGAGTGDMAYEALRQHPGCTVVTADFTLAMMRAGRSRQDATGARSACPDWCAADALILPFQANSFDAVVSGFLMRNVSDTGQALMEQQRVLKPGGQIVILDTTRPRHSRLSPLVWIHLHLIIPTLGQMLTGQRDAYTYLPDSTEAFLTAEQMAERMHTAGFESIGFRLLMFSTVAIHWGTKK